jgi:hypothetical protein
MRNHVVKVGASVPAGVEGVELLLRLKLGNFMLGSMPNDYASALATARRCREKGVYFAFAEFLFRGSRDLYMMGRKRIPRSEFLTRKQLDRVVAAGGKYYLGRMTLGEVGGLLYWPKRYVINRACGNYRHFPSVRTVDRARELYVDFMRRTIAYERKLSGGPLLDVESSMTFKYHLQAGIDVPVIESMPGDPEFLIAALRGAARAYERREWGVHIAMHCYGGTEVCDRLWLQRWRASLYHAFLSGATFIYPESGHFGKSKHGINSPEIKTMRRSLRELYRFTAIHRRPAGFPDVRIGFVHGHLDGHPGLWNKYVWGQYKGGRKWLPGPPEWGWDYVAGLHRAGEWWRPEARGAHDFSGHPPGGLGDIVPLEAPGEILKHYGMLVFLGWNTMTAANYVKLKEYVRGGGRILMAVPHLSVETDRGRDLKLLRGGAVSDLFGVRILGRGVRDVLGVRYINPSQVPGYDITTWACDQKFIGEFTPARVRLAGARVLAGVQTRHSYTQAEVEARPLLIEHRLGKGTAFLLTTWSWPGERGLREFMQDVLRIVYAGEQGAIRVSGSDRIRHAVYRRGSITVVYLLNTDPDSALTAVIWVRGRSVTNVAVAPSDLAVLYINRGLAAIPADKTIDVRTWSVKSDTHVIRVVSLRTQAVRLVNLEDNARTAIFNGRRVRLGPRATRAVPVRRRIDPEHREAYAPDFLDEPELIYDGSGLPY